MNLNMLPVYNYEGKEQSHLKSYVAFTEWITNLHTSTFGFLGSLFDTFFWLPTNLGKMYVHLFCKHLPQNSNSQIAILETS